MTFSIKYKPLFEVKILHHFFLDKGDTDFFSMSEKEQEKQLTDFDLNSTLKTIPSTDTNRKLAGHKLVLHPTKHGFTVYASVSANSDITPFINLDDTLELTFLLKLVDNTFFNYTNLDIANAGKLFLFTNKNPEGEDPSFPLIKNSNNTQTVKDKYALSEDGKESFLETLSNAEKNGLFGVVRIFMRADKASLHVTTNQQKIQDPFRIYHIIFDNRKTHWRYFFRENQQVTGQDDVKKENGNSQQLVSRSSHPLTKKGFIAIELGGVELPNPDASVVKPSSTNNKIYSEIYM